jgi:transposase InsO family protein
VYVAFVIDVFARRIIGWRVARSMRTELRRNAVRWSTRSQHLEAHGTNRTVEVIREYRVTIVNQVLVVAGIADSLPQLL